MRPSNQPRESGIDSVVQAETEPAFELLLPTPVAVVLQYAGFALVPCDDWADLLANFMQEYETNARAKSTGNVPKTANVPDPFRSPAFLFWTLASYSNSNLQLTEWQRAALALHSLEASTCIRWNWIPALMSTATTHAVDYCFFFLFRLMVIERGLAKTADPDPSLRSHIRLIHDHYCYLVRDLSRLHELGWLTTACPRDDFASRLIDLGRNEPRLKPIATRIIQDWRQIEKNGHELQFLARVMGSPLHREVEDHFADHPGTADVTDDVADSALARRQVRQKMFSLEQAMTPERDNDRAWHHPLEFIESHAAGRRVIFLDTAPDNFIDEKLSSGQAFQLALLERMAEQGFCRWLFSNPESSVNCIHVWLRDNGDSQSVKSVCDGVQRFLATRSGHRPCSFREVLAFPRASEPEYVTREVRFWEELREAQEHSGAEVRLFMTQHHNERSAALSWLRPGPQRKFVVVGDGGDFQAASHLNRRVSRKRSLVIRHRLATAEDGLDFETFNLCWALGDAAYEVGTKRGWGIHQSAIMPVKGNQRFLGAFASEELKHAAADLHAQFSVTDATDYADAAIFSVDNEAGESGPDMEPSLADSTTPLVGA